MCVHACVRDDFDYCTEFCDTIVDSTLIILTIRSAHAHARARTYTHTHTHTHNPEKLNIWADVLNYDLIVHFSLIAI